MPQDSHPVDRNAVYPLGGPTAEPVSSLDLAKLLFDHMQGQINFADTKAQLTLAADALLAATIAPLGKGIALSLLDAGAPPLARILALVTAAMIVVLMLSVYFALSSARPVMRLKSATPSLFFFGDITQQSESAFIQNFTTKLSGDLQREMLAQVYAKATIARIKFAAIRISLNFLVAALALWVVVQILIAFLP
jgi:pycsar effector protein